MRSAGRLRHFRWAHLLACAKVTLLGHTTAALFRNDEKLAALGAETMPSKSASGSRLGGNFPEIPQKLSRIVAASWAFPASQALRAIPRAIALPSFGPKGICASLNKWTSAAPMSV